MLTLFLSGGKGLACLSALNGIYFPLISQIVIGTDNKIVEDFSVDIAAFCTENNINFTVGNNLKTFTSNYAIAIGWRYIINYSDSQKLIVFHDSLLPKLRGFNPLVTALINGENKIGVTAIYAVTEFDKGPIIDSEETIIKYPIKIEKAIDQISICYIELLKKIVEKIHKKQIITAKDQDESLASYSLWRDENDYFINWNDSAEKIERFVNAVGFPYNGARTKINKKTYIIADSKAIDDLVIENRTNGKVIFKINNSPVVVCGKGLLLLKEVYNIDGTKVSFNKKFRLRFQ